MYILIVFVFLAPPTVYLLEMVGGKGTTRRLAKNLSEASSLLIGKDWLKLAVIAVVMMAVILLVSISTKNYLLSSVEAMPKISVEDLNRR